MEVLTSSEPLPAAYLGGVMALGEFRTFHRGHLAVVAKARALAGREGRPLVVTTSLEGPPPPPDGSGPDPSGVTMFEQRLRLFRREGADAVVLGEGGGRPDDRTIAAARPMAIFVRAGPPAPPAGETSPDAAAVEVVDRVADVSGMITSDRIRAALRDGDCAAATSMLGRPFAVRGEVQHGHKLGRRIGFPTANLLMGNYVRPAYGVYAVRGRLPGGRLLDGVANLGVRPIMDVPEELLEPFFFDFTGDLYDKTIEVMFIERLRGEVKLSSFDELKAWIEKDCEQARSILGATPHVA